MTSNPKTPIAAAIDIGSNSIKMTVARPDAHGGVDQLAWASEVVRLGQGLDTSGRLDERRMDSAIDTLHRFAARARELGAIRIVAVATEATRAAANGEAFLDLVRDDTGIDVRVVDGDEEAALTFRGLAATTDISGSVVIADIGGGSTELIVVRDGAMLRAQSIKLGSGRLTERLAPSDPPTRDELAACEVDAAGAVASTNTSLELPTGKGVRLIVVGGTGEFMARLVPNERHISLATVRQALFRMESLTAVELAAAIDIPEARARVLPAGVAIVAALAERLRPDRIEISFSGVRVGLLLEAFQSVDGAGEPVQPAPGPKSGASTKTKSRGTTASAKDASPTPETGFRESMAALIAERWDAVWDAIPVALDGSDSEGVHDVRVASRRLRAAMDIAAPVFPPGWYKALHRTAKEITGALGEVRDRDVLLAALRADRVEARLPEHPGIDRLIDRVERERVAARVDMEAFLRDLLESPVHKEIERRFGPITSHGGQPGETDGIQS